MQDAWRSYWSYVEVAIFALVEWTVGRHVDD